MERETPTLEAPPTGDELLAEVRQPECSAPRLREFFPRFQLKLTIDQASFLYERLCHVLEHPGKSRYVANGGNGPISDPAYLRESRNMTQKQLADKAGVPQPQIARLESVDDERIPTLEQLVRIFSALDSRAFLEIVPPLQTHAEKREIVLV